MALAQRLTKAAAFRVTDERGSVCPAYSKYIHIYIHISESIDRSYLSTFIQQLLWSTLKVVYFNYFCTRLAVEMSEHTYKFNVTMTCGGCSGAINRVLGKLEGVKSYDVSLDKQEALVVAEPSLDYETVLRTIKKTGKKVNSGEADGEAKSIELAD